MGGKDQFAILGLRNAGIVQGLVAEKRGEVVVELYRPDVFGRWSFWASGFRE